MQLAEFIVSSKCRGVAFPLYVLVDDDGTPLCVRCRAPLTADADGLFDAAAVLDAEGVVVAICEGCQTIDETP